MAATKGAPEFIAWARPFLWTCQFFAPNCNTMSKEPNKEEVDADELISRIKEVLDEADVDTLVQIANDVLASKVTAVEYDAADWMYEIETPPEHSTEL